jgi:hypothetical protein
MSLEDTKVTQDLRSTSQLNDFLEKGWVLIIAYVDDVGEIGAPSGRPHFVVSWQAQGAPHTRTATAMRKSEDRSCVSP